MKIPEMLKKLISLGHTQQDIAHSLDTTQPTISRAINGANVHYELGKAIESLYTREVGIERSGHA